MMKKLLVLLICLCLPFTALAGELSDDEITEILRQMTLEQNEDADFLVVPDTYQAPVTGTHGVYTLLVLGIDTDAGLKGRSDTMILCVLDAYRETVKLVSFMRDLYVKIPGKGHNKLNAAYAFGGAELLMRTLQDSFGVTCDGFLAVNYSTMIALIDEIGGVELTVESNELKPLNGVLEYYNYQRGVPEKRGRLESAGTHTLTGLQAMSYARIRKLDSDFQRVSRQQRMLTAVYKKLVTMPASKLLDVATAYISQVGTDVTVADALELILTAFAMENVQMDTLRVPADRAFASKTINGTYYIVPNLSKNTAAINTFLQK